MREKRDFVKRLLNIMQDSNFINEWEPSGSANRHDYCIENAFGQTGCH